MERHERKLYVQILAQMLIADGVLADEERAHLERVMDRLELSGEERSEALGEVSIDSPVEARVAELGEAARGTLLTEVEAALDADGQRTKSEAYFLSRVRRLLA